MNPRVFALPEDATAAEAVKALQQLGGVEMSFYLYVIDDRRHLVGVVSLRRLLLVPPQATLKQIMTDRRHQRWRRHRPRGSRKEGVVVPPARRSGGRR